MTKKQTAGMSFFERYLTVWVLLCMVFGVLLSVLYPGFTEFLQSLTYAEISIPIAILIWLMIYPMMMKVNFKSVKRISEDRKGIYLTWVINWLIKPFTMYGISYFFFYFVFSAFISPDLAREYVAGAVILGAAPCTAMVFVWSHLTKGDPAYTVVQVATNDLIVLLLYTPIVALLLGVSGIEVPFDTLILSIVLFVVVPLVGGLLTRQHIVKQKGETYFEEAFLAKFKNTTTIGLLLTLILIFMFQGETILENYSHIALIAVPLILQTFFIFFLAYYIAKKLNLTHDIAAPAGMIGASNFFELSVAVAISLFGVTSPVALAVTVGIIVEVPVMLMLVKIANATRHWFSA
ncbi:arsenical-resistance protein [Halolactibacillus alkaliphilus]|uniref:Arsenical-resistance protein n=1 Tax=Halolactibacillus alkaliphilus TaxID=442899 RepID=A0A511X1D4_9BACI|nr:ACR3 family arsenite efflux transporter [Halolactibacillus alkaliphilus]GEN56756.1 arsenical-resistance protein [Halolactibacillus alkaliphilus]GGN70821.1 arsenical-resistance protein [Halolactibacillus alkaliphilus]SFO79834.1 arsenite transporter, ACR3 family [Halolactibacillus alkaliphilus]